MAGVVAICNQKGGVGKTTEVFHLARAAFLADRRVLVIDADPQGSITTVLSAETLPADTVGLADVLSDRTEETLSDVITGTIWAGVDLAPTVGSTLESVRDELVVAGPGREARMRSAIEAVRSNYDLVLIDCPPSLDQLTVNALTASDLAVVVSKSKLLSAEGIARLLQTIETVRTHYAPGLKIGGVVINEHEEHTIAGREWREQIAEAMPLLEPVVPKAVALADALESATGLDEWPSRRAPGLATIYTQHLRAIEGALS